MCGWGEVVVVLLYTLLFHILFRRVAALCTSPCMYSRKKHTKKQEYAEDVQLGLEGVEELDDNDVGFQVRKNEAGVCGGRKIAHTHIHTHREKAIWCNN